jgi:hypothetical protein
MATLPRRLVRCGRLSELVVCGWDPPPAASLTLALRQHVAVSHIPQVQITTRVN